MTLSIAPLEAGKLPLGRWGSLWLTGRQQAVVKSLVTEDFTVPPEAAEEIPNGVAVLNDDLGLLILLPYAGENVVCMDLSEGGAAYPPISVPRHEEFGLRMATVRIVPFSGLLYLTEMSLCCFTEKLELAWRRDSDFLGWTIDGVQGAHILLGKGDPTIGEEELSVSMVDGSPVR